MAIAFFDMDGTIINGDTNDLVMGKLKNTGLIDEAFIRKLESFEETFYRGCLDIYAFMRFASAPFKDMSAKQRDDLLASVVKEVILPRVYPGALRTIKFHKANHDAIAIVTSTADFLAKHVASLLGIDNVIATPIECVDGKVTGNIVGEPAYKELKVTKIKQFVQEKGLSLDGAYAYGDSINDVPMLLLCSHKIAVNPNEKLLNDPVFGQLECVDWSV